MMKEMINFLILLYLHQNLIESVFFPAHHNLHKVTQTVQIMILNIITNPSPTYSALYS